MKRQLISCASALFFLAIFNCKRDMPDPECRDASCCEPFVYIYAEDIVDLPAHLSGPPQFSTWGFDVQRPFPTGVPAPYSSTIFSICGKSLYKISGFTPDVWLLDESKMSYNYRISGKLFYSRIPNFLPNLTLSFYIDKIEKIK